MEFNEYFILDTNNCSYVEILNFSIIDSLFAYAGVISTESYSFVNITNLYFA